MCETFFETSRIWSNCFVEDSFPSPAWKSTWIRHSWNCRVQEPWIWSSHLHSQFTAFLLLQPLRLLSFWEIMSNTICWLAICANFCRSKSSTCFRWIDLELLFCRRWHTSLKYLQCAQKTSFWPRDLRHSSEIEGENVIVYFGFEARKFDRISRRSILAILAMRRWKEPSRVESRRAESSSKSINPQLQVKKEEASSQDPGAAWCIFPKTSASSGFSSGTIFPSASVSFQPWVANAHVSPARTCPAKTLRPFAATATPAGGGPRRPRPPRGPRPCLWAFSSWETWPTFCPSVFRAHVAPAFPPFEGPRKTFFWRYGRPRRWRALPTTDSNNADPEPNKTTFIATNVRSRARKSCYLAPLYTKVTNWVFNP